MLFAEIKAHAYGLQLACEWDERTLLARLGCTIDLQRDAVDDDVDLDGMPRVPATSWRLSEARPNET